MAVGYSPAAHLLHHAGAKFAYDTGSHMYRPDSVPAHVFAAGSVNQAYALDAVLADGRRAGWLAARDAGLAAGAEPPAPIDLGCGMASRIPGRSSRTTRAWTSSISTRT